jgi:simple sugar transport system permease protein
MVAVLVTWWLLTRTRLGLALRALGGSVGAARTAGVNTTRAVLIAMLLSGAFAGLGGAVEVLGTRGRLLEGFSVGYGFEAIAVALLGRLHPAGVVAAALLFGALDAGGSGLQAAGGSVSAGIVQLTAGCAMVYVLAALGVATMLRRRAMIRAQLRAAARDATQPASTSVAVIR